MKGWILYKRNAQELTKEDHGVNRLRISAQAKGIQLEVYKPEQFDILSATVDHQSIFVEQKLVKVPDFVIPRIGAESSYLALAVLRHLEEMGVYVCNSSIAVALAKDKMMMSQKLRGSGLPTPQTMLVKFPISLSMVQSEIGFPLVIKTISGARGFGVYLCESPAQFSDMMDLLSLQNPPNGILLQEFIHHSFGCDLRVFVLGGEVIGCMKRSAKAGFKANYSLGGHVETYPLSEEVEKLALKTAQLFNLEIAGIDLLFTPNGFTVCEANSSPGFKGMEKATGSDIATQIITYIETKLS